MKVQPREREHDESGEDDREREHRDPPADTPAAAARRVLRCPHRAGSIRAPGFSGRRCPREAFPDAARGHSGARSDLLGGCVGGVLRAALAEGASHRPGQWPWATFLVNILGALLLGYLVP